MKNKLNLILGILLVIAVGIIGYQNLFQSTGGNQTHDEGAQLYTCGMHPNIISEEPGNCPICEMKLTPIKKEKRSDGQKKIAYWAAPMDPNEIYDSPGKSKMGMDLVPVYEEDIQGEGVVKIDPVVQQNMNIKLHEVKSMTLSQRIETNAVLQVDERKEYKITSRVGGWIEKLFVNYTGQEVRKGQKLMDIYSPELVAAQQEFITALNYKNSMQGSSLAKSGDELLKNSIRKLELLEMSARDIQNLRNSNEVKTYVTLYAPASGVVLMKNVVEGTKIMPGTDLLQIADLTNIWIIADLYESEIPRVKVGDKATITVNAIPNRTFEGKVSFIYPTLDPKTRTAKVRIEVANSNLELKPSMLAAVAIEGKTLNETPVIPESALIRSGRKNVAVLALGEGKFKPVELKLGVYAEGYYQVLQGLQPGNKVVTSAQFLIDSESSLKSAINKFSSGGDQQKNMNEFSDMEMEGHSDHKMIESEEHLHSENEYGVDSPLIRTGDIDLASIDENGDGMLYECPMDWNIIGDEYKRCPVCEMKMKEYSIDDVKKNLDEHGYKYKK